MSTSSRDINLQRNTLSILATYYLTETLPGKWGSHLVSATVSVSWSFIDVEKRQIFIILPGLIFSFEEVKANNKKEIKFVEQEISINKQLENV